MNDKRAARLRCRFKTGGFRNPEEDWPAIQDEMIDGMIRLEKAIAPRIENLEVDL